MTKEMVVILSQFNMIVQYQQPIYALSNFAMPNWLYLLAAISKGFLKPVYKLIQNIKEWRIFFINMIRLILGSL